MIPVVVLTVVSVFLVFYLLWTKDYDYWKRRNVKCIEPSFPFGSIKDVFLGKKNLAALIQEFYEAFPNEPLVGFYSPNKPYLLVRSPEFIKEVIVTKFKDFSETGFEMPSSRDPLYSNNPFALQNYDQWKKVRAVHSPLMTPRSVKQMVDDMKKPADCLVRYLGLHTGEPLNVMDVCRNYTVDSVAGVAYGVESDWFFQPETAFLINTSEKLFGTSKAMWYSNTASFFFPWLFKVMRLTFVSDLAIDYFKSIAKEIVTRRKMSNVQRQDLTQRLISLDEAATENGGQRNNTWSFLHTMAAYYPDQPTEQQRHDMREFFRTFAQFYPCPTCAENFRHELRIMPPMVNCSSELSHWLCLIHNRVNIRLGKPQFDCSRLRERWKDGWKDGSCDF